MISDVAGTFPRYDGGVGRDRKRDRYSHISGWDIYRTQIPLLALLEPRVTSDVVRSLLGAADESGALPKWPVAAGHTNVMTGDPADPIIAGAWAMGARDFDVGAALARTVAGATRPLVLDDGYSQRPGLAEYQALGYVPFELNADPIAAVPAPHVLAWGSAATTLEYALADFSISCLAEAAGAAPLRAEFLARSACVGERVRPGDPVDGAAAVERRVRRRGGHVRRRLRRGQRVAVLVDGPARSPQPDRRARWERRDSLAARRLPHRSQHRDRLDPRVPRQRTDAAHAVDLQLARPSGGGARDDPPRAARALRRGVPAASRATTTSARCRPGTRSRLWASTRSSPGPTCSRSPHRRSPAPEIRLGGGRKLTVVAPGAGRKRPYVSSVTLDGVPLERSWIRVGELGADSELRYTLSTTPTGWAAAGTPPPDFAGGAPCS